MRERYVSDCWLFSGPVSAQYGNYAIQAVLELAPAKVRTSVKRKMEGKYTKLSKYARDCVARGDF
jgi:hypothetical protein